MTLFACCLGTIGSSLTAQEIPASPVEQQFLSNIRQLTFEGSRAGEGYFNADGSLMVFQSERRADNPFFQIYLLDFETGEIEPVSPGHGKTTCAWIHPLDPNLVLFSSTHDDPSARQKQREEIEFRESGQTRRYAWDYDPHFEIYTFDRRAQTYRRLTEAEGYDAEGSFSPDGRLIAFASNRRGFSEELPEELKKRFEIDPSILMDIYLMNSDGTDVRQLTRHVGYDGGPFFSPDGSRICWRRFSEDGLRAEIMTMNIDGSDQRQLTQMNVLSWAPFYHPSGKYLIFTTNKHGFGNFELYLVAADGKSMPVRVTDCEGFDGLASFTPDGRRLTWTSARNPKKESQIYLADWNHEQALAALIDSGVSELREGQSEASSSTPAAAPSAAGSPGELPEGIEPWYQSLPQSLRDRIRLADLWVEEPAAAKLGIEAALKTSVDFLAEDLAAHVEYLCHPELEGRLTGTPGERMATAYAAGYLAALGLQPGGDAGSWFQSFQFPTGVELGQGNQLTITEVDGTASDLITGREWRPVAFSANIEVPPSEIVFAGYGIVAPEQGDQAAYNSFANLDVQGKWVMMLRFEPEDVPAERRTHLQFYSGIRKKAFYARELGARGVIFVSGPAARVQDQLVPLQRDFAPSGFSLAAISVSDEVALDWLAAANQDLGKLQQQLDRGEQVEGFAIPDLRLGGRFQMNTTTGTGRNVIARLQAGDAPSPTAVLIGAHVDHLGRGEMGTSLAKGEDVGQIHFGADDNASGVAAVLEIAEYLSDQQRQGKLPLQHDIVFAIWSGEELGLHGSKHFVQKLNAPPAEPAADRSSRQFVLGIDRGGAITVNGKSASSQELAGSLAYLGSNHPDFVVEVRQSPDAPPEQVAQLLDLAEKNGVQHLKIVMQASEADTVRPLVAALNLDMVGRFRDKLILQGTGSSDYWAKAIESRNAVLGLPLTLHSDTNLPTDASSFYAAGIPILSAFTGSHADYHTPRDTPDKLNYEAAAKIARLMGLITRGLATDPQLPDYRRQELQVQRSPRAGLRAYLGTAPSYGEDIVGVLLYDVTPGSPADKAGVKAGDVIVGLGAKTIEDIYDYTAALDSIKIGEETDLIVERDGQKIQLKIIPGSRQ